MGPPSRPSEGAGPAKTSVSNCSFQDWETGSFCCGSHSVGGTLWYFVTTPQQRNTELTAPLAAFIRRAPTPSFASSFQLVLLCLSICVQGSRGSQS